MKEAYSAIVDGKQVTLLRDMTQEEIEALEASRLETDMQTTVSAAQALITLSKAGLLEQVTEIIKQSDNVELKIFFDRQPTWRRDSPYIESIRKALGLTNEQVTDLFKQAQSVV